jgi:hypothetical protein
VTDTDRSVVVQHIQQAVAADVVPFDGLDDRFGAVFSAETRADLDAVIADLPQPPSPAPPPVPHPLPSSSFALIGDVKVGGWVRVEGDLTYSAIIGDMVIDLSSVDLPGDVTITTWSLIGDTTVIVPDGVRAVLQAVRVLGDQKTDLAPGRAGSPVVQVKVRSLIGDAELISLSRLGTSSLRKLWRRLRSG